MVLGLSPHKEKGEERIESLFATVTDGDDVFAICYQACREFVSQYKDKYEAIKINNPQ